MEEFLRLHKSREAFRRALGFTEAATGFLQRLIEKDYYCSLILADFESLFASGLVFKGGTYLSKVCAQFYRLSEDLDFAISIPTTARPRERRLARLPVKQHLEGMGKRLSVVRMIGSPLGHDGNRQYNAVLRYQSVVTGEEETVKVQVAVREPVIESTVSCVARTLLHNPASGETPETRLSLRGMSQHEAYAEKVRAALTRDPPAIRDFFDIGDVVEKGRLDLAEPRFLNLVRQKLGVPGTPAIDTTQARRAILEEQLESHLKPVLRSSDYATFDIERAFTEVERLAALLHGA